MPQYKIILGPVMVTEGDKTRQAQDGETIELTESDATPLIKSGVLSPLMGEEPPIATLASTMAAPSPPETLPTVPVDPATTANPLAPTRATREQELKQLFEAQGWQSIKAIADSLKISKPSQGWDAAIPLILDKEFPQS